jgi:NAD(P)-dependent dehydrogenase (short-subunit alcohol dehydrogenase family)
MVTRATAGNATAAFDFSGKVVLVTGGTKGIGAGIAQAFLDAGATVYVCGRTAPEVVPQAARGTARFIGADVREQGIQ